MSGAFTLSIDADRVGWLVLDVPGAKLNVLTSAVLEELESRIAEARSRASEMVGLVVASGKEGSFIAGADVDEIARVDDAQEGARLAVRGQAIFQALADLPFPTVAAINGICLGGGTEMVLACDLRIAADDDSLRIGLPEVRLGILPGFGGTQRLPRRIGLRGALDLILTGKNLDPRRGLRAGLFDAVVPRAYLRREAAALARRAAERGVGAVARRTGGGLAALLLERNPIGRAIVVGAARRQLLRTTGGHYPAPARALQSTANALRMDLQRGLAEEARLVGELLASRVSKNLVRIFQASNAVKKRTGVDGEARPLPVRRAGLLGAGTMGGGIGWLLADHQIPVRMKDVRQEALSAGMEAAAGIFGRAVKRRRLTAREMERRMDRLSPTLDYRGFGAVDVVIEAIVERLDVKKAVLGEVEKLVGPSCVLASNTSSLPITRIGEGLEQPGRLVGMHFFNPVDRMPLVEVIRGERSDDTAVATIYALARDLGKTPVVVRDGPGFLVNRILAPYMNEAVMLVRDGASIADVDRALKRFGMPMGPLMLFDQVGLDVAAHAAETLGEAFGERMGDASPIAKMIEAGRLGRKNGLGFYRHDGKKAEPDPAAERIVRAGSSPSPPPAHDEIVERCTLRMIDESARCLADRIVDRADDLDLAMIFGTGFPPFRGGVLRHADSLGLGRVVESLERLAALHGLRFRPCDRLRQAASSGESLGDGAATSRQS